MVVHRHASTLAADVLELVEKDAHGLVGLVHPNVVPVLATLRLKGDVAVICQWVDGASLAELREVSAKIPVEIGLRVVRDVLDGLFALHANASLSFGAVTPEDVVVGLDGVTRITRNWLGRATPLFLSSRRAIHAAPEVLRGDSGTPQADVFSSAVLLWEVLAGRPLFEPALAEQQLVRLEWEEIPRLPNVESALADVVTRALHVERDERTGSLEKLASEIDAIAPSIASHEVVAAWVRDVAGERVRERRALHDATHKLSATPPPPDVTVPPPAVESIGGPEKPAPEPPPAAVEVHEPPPEPTLAAIEKSAPEPAPVHVATPREPAPVHVEKPAAVAPSPEPAPAHAAIPKPAGSSPRFAPRPIRQQQPTQARAMPDPKPAAATPAKPAPVVATLHAPFVARPHAPLPPLEELDEMEAMSVPPSAPIADLSFEDDAPKPPAREEESDEAIDVAISLPPPPIDVAIGLPPLPTEPAAADMTENSDTDLAPKRRSGLASLFVGVCIFVLGFATGRMWPVVAALPAPPETAPRVSSSSAPSLSSETSAETTQEPLPESATTEPNESEAGTPLGLPAVHQAPGVVRVPRDVAHDAIYAPSGI